jgi:ankyrin repeat protein
LLRQRIVPLPRTILYSVAVGLLVLTGCSNPKRDALRELNKRGLPATADALLAAVQRDDASAVSLMLQAGVYSGQRDSTGNTPLLVALKRSSLPIVFSLIDNGADLNAATPKGVTPVSLAVAQGETAVADRLLNAGAKPEGNTPDGDHVLPWAIRNGRLVFVQRLMREGADPHQKDGSGDPLTHVAVEAGRRDLAVEILKLGADPAETNAQGESLLSAALRKGWRDWIDDLVRAGADPNLPDRNGVCLFDAAFRSGDLPLARELAGLGARPQGGAWGPALWTALETRDRARLRFLLSVGAPADAALKAGLRPVEYALRRDDADSVHLLLSYGAKLDGLFEQARQRGWNHMTGLLMMHGAVPLPLPAPFLDTPLGLAIRAGDLNTVKMLLNDGMSPVAPLAEGQPPLHLAVVLGHSRIVKELLNRGVDPNSPLLGPLHSDFIRQVRGGTVRWLLKNDDNITPLMLAADSGNAETARALLRAGAKQNVWTKRNHMWPINIASNKGDVTMMRVILGKDPQQEQRRIVVDLSTQKAIVYDSNGQEIFTTRVSTGRPGYATPTGTYAITNKYRDWNSTIYHGASMPYFQRLSCSDFGFHQGEVPNRPASHGCIRVPSGVATKLFALTEVGDRVIIQQ